MYVLAPGEQQSVHAVERAGRIRRAKERREQDGHAPRRQDRAYVRGIHAGPLGAVPGPEHAADGDAGRAHGSTESGKKGQRGSSIRDGSSWIPMRGTVTAPTVTLPICGAPSTGMPSNSITPRVVSAVSSTSTP